MLLFRGVPPWWWLGLGLVLATAVTGITSHRVTLSRWWSQLQQPTRSGRLRFRPATLLCEAGVIAVLATICAIMLPGVLGGDPPGSEDHPVHLFKAWQLKQLLLEGHLYGWSHFWHAGYPVSYLYPVGGELLVLLPHALSLGMIDLGSSYALTVWLAYFLVGYSVYVFGARASNRVVGLLAAIAILVDPGGARSGGWIAILHHANWPNALSIAWSLFAAAQLDGLLYGRRWRALGLYALFMGLALLTHPLQMFFYLYAIPLVVALLLTQQHRRHWGHGLLRFALATTVGLLISALWMLPFLAHRSETGSYGVWWMSAYEMGERLIEGTLLFRTWGALIPFGCLGILVLLRRSNTLARFAAAFALLVLTTGNSTFVDEFHLTQLLPSLANIQFVRLSGLVRPFYVLIALVVVWSVLQHGFRAVRRPERPVTASPLRLFVTVLLGATLVAPIGVAAIHHYLEENGQVYRRTESERASRANRLELAAWLDEHLPAEPFYRIAHDLQRDFMDLPLELAQRSDKPHYAVGRWFPAETFRYKMTEGSLALLDALNVRYYISRKTRISGFRLLTSVGSFKVHERTEFNPDPFAVVDGEGEVQLISMEREEIVLRAKPGAHGTLRLNVSHFSNWRATRDGEEVPLETLQLGGDEQTGFIGVPLKEGEYRFSFRRGAVDHLGPLLGLLGVLLALLLFLMERDRPRWRRWRRQGNAILALGASGLRLRQRTILRAARGAMVVGILCLMGLAAWTPPLTWIEGEASPIAGVRYDFLESLTDAEVFSYRKNKRTRCPTVIDRFVCDQGDWYHVASRPERLEWFSQRRCISVHPPARGQLELDFPEVPLGDALVGSYGIAWTAQGGHVPVTIEVLVNEKKVLTVVTKSDHTTSWFKAELDPGSRRGELASVKLRIRAHPNSQRHLCLHMQMVDLVPTEESPASPAAGGKPLSNLP